MTARTTAIKPPETWRTSVTEPFPVDWVDLRLVPGLAEAVTSGGALGMSYAPGKVDPYWKHDRDLAADIERLRAVHHVDTLVLLIEDGELRDLRIEALPEVAAAAGIELIRYPIPDFGIPTDQVVFGRLVDDVLARIGAGGRVVVACKGGYGRTGAVTGALLRASGVGSTEAVSLVRGTRPGTIEMPSQAEFVQEFRAPRTN